MVDFPETHQEDTRRLHRRRVPAECRLGGEIQLDQLRSGASSLGRSLAARSEVLERLHCVLVWQGRQPPQLFILGCGFGLATLLRHWGPHRGHAPAAGPDRELRSVGKVESRRERAVLADRRPRRHGGFDRRQRLSRDDQQLSVRRCTRDCADRGTGGQDGHRQ